MAEELPDPSLQEARPVSRRGKGKAKTTTNDEAGLHIMNQDVGAAEASTSRTEQQTKERKKPRKLERRSVVIEEPAVTLDTRVEFLENQMQALSTRMDTVEVRQVRRPIASSYRRSSSNSTRAASSARPRKRITSPRPHSGNIPRPSLAEQLRESQRLRRTAQRHKSNESIEEVPRSSLTTASASRQVALTGQYNIPLPSNLSTEDILNLKSGMAAAGSIARSLASALTTNREPGSGTSSPRRTDVGGSRPAAATGYKDPSVEHGEEDKENIAGESGGNSTSSAPHVGNRQPEGTDREVFGAENASKTWRSFISDAGRFVASAAKDAAVEIQNAPVAPANVRTPSGRAGSNMRTGNVLPLVTGASSSTESTRGSSNARRKPLGSRTSSRASSRV